METLDDRIDVAERASTVPNGQDHADLRAIVGLPAPGPNQRRMYAITFDMDIETLQQAYPGEPGATLMSRFAVF